ncbi:hypothetical protein CEXT_611001, partial [Caerostris extrusa]
SEIGQSSSLIRCVATIRSVSGQSSPLKAEWGC